ncbi:MAG: Na+/H+ antiporter NhaA, partial [Dietzia sp.]|nr:Na+/H+ antiporter NhaA [Dietzia sp.]
MTEPTTQRGFPLLPSRLNRGSKATRTTDNTAAALLLAATVFAILWANSPWAQSYSALLDTHLGLTLGVHQFEMTVKHLVNDGLMAF